jgi:hypothetical protein
MEKYMLCHNHIAPIFIYAQPAPEILARGVELGWAWVLHKMNGAAIFGLTFGLWAGNRVDEKGEEMEKRRMATVEVARRLVDLEKEAIADLSLCAACGSAPTPEAGESLRELERMLEEIWLEGYEAARVGE